MDTPTECLTPWLEASEEIIRGVDWLSDIARIEGEARSAAIDEATVAFDRADAILNRLATDDEDPDQAAFARTLRTLRDLVQPVREGLPAGRLFRHIALREMALTNHAPRRTLEQSLLLRRVS